MTAYIAPQPKYQFLAADGSPLVGGKLYTYAAGTTTPLATYTDSSGVTPNANPVILDSRGEANIWLSTAGYKLVLKDATDVEIWTVDNVYAGATLAQLAASGGSNLIGFIQSGTGAVATTVQTKLRNMGISVRDFGATGDGSTDDSTAITAAEAAAYAAGKPLVFPPGTYIFSGQFTCRVSIDGYGATLMQKAAVDTTTPLVLYTSPSNIYVRGITLDGNDYTPGLRMTSATNVRVIDVTVNNVGFGGIAFYTATNVMLSNCVVNGCRYVTVGGTVQVAADGIYAQEATNIRIVNCFATNFQRIGFVIEGTVSSKSDNIQFANCVASDASNSDTKSTEFNAGFWHENANNVSYVNCSALNIASGIGQTAGRVRGFVCGGAQSATCVSNYVNCVVDGNTTNMPYAFNVQGVYGQNYLSASLVNCSVKKCNIAFSSLGGLDELSIRDFVVYEMDASALQNQGAIIFDFSPSGATTTYINHINIDGLTVNRSASVNADSGDIHFIYGDTRTNLTINNAGTISCVMRTAIGSVKVTNTLMTYGSTTYDSIFANNIVFGTGFVGSLRSGATTKALFRTAGAAATYVTFEPGSAIINVQADQHVQPIYAATGTLYFSANGAIFKYVKFSQDISAGVTCYTQFSNCWVANIGADVTVGAVTYKGFLFTNFGTGTLIVSVIGNRFVSDAVGYTPFQFWNADPTKIIFQANTYTATNLYSGFTAGNVSNLAGSNINI